MPDTDPQLRHWLSVHQRVRRHIQRIVLLLALLAATAVIQGFGRLQSLNEGYQFAREFTLQLQEEGPREEVARLYKEGHRRVRLEQIPEVGWEYGRFLSKHQPSGVFNVLGYELGYASLGFVFVLVPFGLLVVIYLRLRATAKIALMLREKAVDGSEVQQSLNSVFNERATERLGEYRRLYATVWALVILILAVTPPIFFLTAYTMRVIDTYVEIDQLGTITPLADVSLGERTYTVMPDDGMLGFTMVPILASMGLAVFVWRSVSYQLRSKGRRAKKPTSDAA